MGIIDLTGKCGGICRQQVDNLLLAQLGHVQGASDKLALGGGSWDIGLGGLRRLRIGILGGGGFRRGNLRGELYAVHDLPKRGGDFLLAACSRAAGQTAHIANGPETAVGFLNQQHILARINRHRAVNVHFPGLALVIHCVFRLPVKVIVSLDPYVCAVGLFIAESPAGPKAPAIQAAVRSQGKALVSIGPRANGVVQKSDRGGGRLAGAVPYSPLLPPAPQGTVRLDGYTVRCIGNIVHHLAQGAAISALVTA